MKSKFDVTGMTCSSCQTHVEKAVNKLNGVQSVNVNLLSNNMVVEFDNNKVDNERIAQAVINAGYDAILIDDNKKLNNKENIGIDNVIKSMKKRLIISIIFWIPLMYVSMYHMFYEWFKIPIPQFVNNLLHGTENAITFGFLQFLLLLPIMYVNRNYFIIGFKKLFKRSPNMDSLIAIGSTASIVYGIYAIFSIGYGLGHNNIEIVNKFLKDIYFESAGTILTLITVGKYLETKSKGKTSEAISKLVNLAPKTAIVIINGIEKEIESKNILQNDIILVKPGGSIPVDGIIVEGETTIDQSSITGESLPVQKNVNDDVVSGTINGQGTIKFRATKVGDNTTLAQIIKLVEEAANSKAPISRLADKVAGVFVPIVILIAIFATIFWIFMGQSFEFALSIGIAVLVISCPCALGLATPVAIMVGTGKGAENGILIKSAESLELLHKIDTIVFDKTGTITEGKPKVIKIITNQDIINEEMAKNSKIKVVTNEKQKLTVQNNLLKIAASIEKKSEHPLAKAITQMAEERNIELLEVEEFEAVLGRGVRAKIDNNIYFGGNLAFMEKNEVNIKEVSEKIEEIENAGQTPLYFSKGKNLIGIITVADTIKQTSKFAIQELKKNKLDTIMLTGDNKKVAKTIASIVGIDKVISEVMPQDKEKEVERLQKEGKKVAFVGDGINDSPALVRADVGIAIGSGTDIAIESADVVLVRDDLVDVLLSIELSKKVINNIKMNLFWAFFYNIVGIPIAAGVFYLGFSLKLNPMIAAGAMSLSSVCVVTNALRLKNFKNKYNNKNRKENKPNKIREEKQSMKVIKIEGMHCNHCKMSVEKVLKNIDGIDSVEVDLEKKQAIIKTSKEVSNDIIKAAIEEEGFNVVEE